MTATVWCRDRIDVTVISGVIIYSLWDALLSRLSNRFYGTFRDKVSMLLDEVEGKYLSAVSGATATLGYIHEDSLVWVVYREV